MRRRKRQRKSITLRRGRPVAARRLKKSSVRQRGHSESGSKKTIEQLKRELDEALEQQAATADNGEMVAAWLKAEEETTLKKLYREPNRIRLQPANTRMKPIYANPKNVEVQGKVIGVIRQVAVA